MENHTPPPLEPVTPTSKPSSGMSFRAIIRDIVIVIILTGVGGFIVGISGASRSSNFMNVIAVSNMLMGTIGFTISGSLARGQRWRHLWFVALGVWIFGIINVIFYNFSILNWITSIIAISIMTGAGGGLSYLFSRNDTPAR